MDVDSQRAFSAADHHGRAPRGRWGRRV